MRVGEGDESLKLDYQVGGNGDKGRVMSIDDFLELEVPVVGVNKRGIEECQFWLDCLLEGALGALGDVVEVWVMEFLCHHGLKSTNNCFGGMMLIFGLLEALEMEALVDVMDVDSG
ncbi:hypothetical protein Tco_0128385 [Tanacetum coccineum]